MRGKVINSVLLLFLFLISIGLVDSLFYQPSTIQNASFTNEKNELAKFQQHVFTTLFYKNRGQVKDDEITFFGNLPGGQIGFGISKVFIRAESNRKSLILSFEGSRSVIPRGVREADYNANFFLGERGTYTNVRVYTSIVYDNLWSGVDLVYKGTEHGAKYEFHIDPGVDPAQIKVRCEGHDNLMIRKNSLNINTDDTLFIDDGLIAFQGNNEIKAEFETLDHQSYGFKIDEYDTSEPLIIDPLVYFSTINASLDDWGWAMTLDAYGSVYVTGWTESWDFPVISAYDNQIDGPTDCFVFKLSPDGNSLAYSTFIGGSDREQGNDIRVDASGNAYISGWTNSEDFPTVNAYNNTYNGDGSIFVCKLSPYGDDLIYSTYVGGSDAESSTGMAIDLEGNAFVCGWTYSHDFPMVDPFDSTHNGGGDFGDDIFVFKLNPEGDSLLFSTYVGGSDDDVPTALELDSSGNIYVTGYTYSENLPATENAYETEHDLWMDIFLFKLNPRGDTMIYFTYISASRYEAPNDIAVDASGAVYMVGFTTSPGFPEVNAYDTTVNGRADCFMLKVSPLGDCLLYSTRIGGNDTEQLLSVAVDEYGCAYAGGFTDSWNYPTINAYNETYPGGDTSGIILKMDEDGNELLYSTYIGSNRDDFIGGINIDSSGTVYAGGITVGFINDTHNRDNSSALFFLKLTDWSDGDKDNMPHAWELDYGLNPHEDDGDGDLDSDGLSNSDEYAHGTDPTNSDSDGDGYPDGLEVDTGYDPMNPVVGIMQILSYNLIYILIAAGIVTLIVLYIKKDVLYNYYWNR
jgi:hypothetical protein